MVCVAAAVAGIGMRGKRPLAPDKLDCVVYTVMAVSVWSVDMTKALHGPPSALLVHES